MVKYILFGMIIGFFAGLYLPMSIKEECADIHAVAPKTEVIIKEKILYKDRYPAPVAQQPSSGSPEPKKPIEERTALQRFKQLLEKNQYSELIALYSEQLGRTDIKEYTLLLYAHVDRMLKRRDPLSQSVIEQLNEVDYGNPYFTILAAREKIGEEAFKEAFLLLHSLPLEYLESAIQKPALHDKKIAKEHYAKELLNATDRDAIATFISQLDSESDQSLIAQLNGYLLRLKRKEELARYYHVQIPIKDYGKHHLVALSINGSRPIELILDTGASHTHIKQAVIDQLHLPWHKQELHVNTANGTIKERLYRAKTIQVAEVKLSDFPIVSITNYPDTKSGGLLGMSFLGLFHWEIDKESGVLYLEQK
jgi:clan AA aspartic protease (TIGR02281 family)